MSMRSRVANVVLLASLRGPAHSGVQCKAILKRKESSMRRTLCLAILAAFGAIVVALPASASSTQEFKAQFHDSDCLPSFDFCGKGLVKGFGTVTTALTITSFVSGPGANCVTVTADRVVTLDSDGSTLLLAVAPSPVCDQKFSGAFTMVGGTGVFAGATGGGTLSGVLIPNGSPAHYRGTITLP